MLEAPNVTSTDLDALSGPDRLEVRELISSLEAAMFAAPQVAIETRHTFADGLYAREIDIPAGTLLTGKIHGFEHINIVSKGSISVLTENGARRIDAPCTFVAQPGTKRVGYAHEDTVWTTIHALSNDVRDPDEAEALLILASHPDAVALSDAEVASLIEGAAL